MELTREVVKNWVDTDKVSLDQVWEMVGFSTKGNAKRRLIEELEEGVDFNLIQIDKVHYEGNRSVSRKTEDVIMTKEAFKIFAASAHTEKGKEVRRYLVNFEQSFNPAKKSPELLMAEALFLAQDTINKSKLMIEEMKPKAEFFDRVTGSKTLISIQDAAKVLNFKKLGQNNLFKLLREKQVLDRKNQPYQIYVDRGYFKVIEVKWEKRGDVQISLKTMVTQKGLNHIKNLILKQPEQYLLNT